MYPSLSIIDSAEVYRQELLATARRGSLPTQASYGDATLSTHSTPEASADITTPRLIVRSIRNLLTSLVCVTFGQNFN
jgi:hypothetical protein